MFSAAKLVMRCGVVVEHAEVLVGQSSDEPVTVGDDRGDLNDVDVN